MNILFMGLGSIGQRHLRNIRYLRKESKLSAYRRVGNRETIQEGAVSLSKQDFLEAHDVTSTDDLELALESKPDAVIISSPTSLHVSDAMLPLQRGIPTFIEKPISNSFDQARKLEVLCEEQPVTTMVGFQLRFHPLLQELKNRIEAKELGSLCFVEACVGQFLPEWHPYEDYRLSYAARSELGGGVILTLIHEIDYLVWLFGMPTTVYAITGTDTRLTTDTEDIASSLLEYRINKKVVPVYLQQNYSESPINRRCKIVGVDGTLELDFSGNFLRHNDETGREVSTMVVDKAAKNDLFMAEMRHFLDCVENGNESLVPISEAIKSQLVAERMRSSASSRTVQSVR